MTKVYDGICSLNAEVRAGTTARSLVERVLARVSAAPELNAVVALREPEALREADAFDADSSPSKFNAPLAGIPIFVKDNEDVAGLKTTYGSLVFDSQPAATTDSLVVSRLKKAGAIVAGKTNVPEFCIEGYTANGLFGATLNPWNLEFSPGGSSGGSAAALAAGLIPLATATDGAGSARIPASFCGLFGLKPSNGVIGREAPPEWIDFSTPGIMSPYARDLEIVYDVLAGPTAGDMNAIPCRLPAANAAASQITKVFATISTKASYAQDAEVMRLFVDAVQAFADIFGVTVTYLDPGEPFSDANSFTPDDDWYTMAAAEHVAFLTEKGIDLNDATKLMSKSTLSFLDSGARVTTAEYLAAKRRLFNYTRTMDELLPGDSILLTPTVPVAGYAPDHGDELLAAENYASPIHNMSGHPALNVPAGRFSSGLPFGMQVTGARWSDRSLIEIAKIWQQNYDFTSIAPGYEPFGRA